MKKSYDLIPRSVKWITSIFCLILLIVHVYYSEINLDWVSVVLLGFVLFPWFIHLITSVKLPGGTELDLGTFQQDTADTPAPSSQEPIEPKIDLLSDAHVLKTLKTIWKYQQEYFSDDPVKRWTFKVIPPAPEYGDYLSSVAELYKAGYITVHPEKAFCMLTNEGISFCKKNTNRIMDSPNIYHF